MKILVRELPPIGTNVYLLINEAIQKCVVIDASQGAYDWAQKVASDNKLSIEALILTHGHWDHTIDAHRFQDAGIQIVGHEDDLIMFTQPELMMTHALPGLQLKPVSIDKWIGGGDLLDLETAQLKVAHVPGHCPGNVSLYHEASKSVFVGDALFKGSIGRCDLPLGDFATLERSVREEIYTLPVETVVYPGHGPTTTVGVERSTNPFVKAIR